jgi:uncharacterized protein with von Willebrand factor type A (vWA) domain
MTLYDNIDKWDTREWSKVLNRNANLQNVEVRLDHKAPDGGAILHDVYWGLYKGDPRVKEDEDIAASQRWMKGVMDSLKETNEWNELRSRCRLNPIDAESATNEIVKTLEPMVPQLYRENEEQTNEAPNGEAKSEVQSLLDMLELDDETPSANQPGMQLRKVMRQAAKKAIEEIDAIDDAMYGMGWGGGDGKSSITSGVEKMQLAKLLRDNPDLRKIAELAGKLRRIATRTQKSKPRHGTDEVHSVTVGDDLARLIPIEMAYLNHPELKFDFIRRLVEKQVQHYELRGVEREAKGPIVFCIDESGSMKAIGPDGVTRDVWAKASMLAVSNIAREQKRGLIIIHFSDCVKRVDVFEPGKFEFIDLVESALYFANGNTDFEAPLTAVIDRIDRAHMNDQFKQSDVIFITDGVCTISDAFLNRFNEFKTQYDVKCVGFSVMDKGITTLRKFCDDVAPVYGMTGKSQATDLMFAV